MRGSNIPSITGFGRGLFFPNTSTNATFFVLGRDFESLLPPPVKMSDVSNPSELLALGDGSTAGIT
jgi:hypothetical protein